MESPHEVLEVPPDADDDTVVDAYRERIKEVHPDHGGSATAFKRVRRAYEQLLNGETSPLPEEDAGEPTPERDDDDERPGSSATEGSMVEYLDYEVLADYGWALDDEDLFEKAGKADLGPDVYGHLVVGPHESLLEAAESAGFAWPYACRGGACTNCAVMILDGEMPTPKSHILPQEMVDRGIRLSCIAAPESNEARIVFNVKHLPGVDELRLPPTRFKQAQDD